MTKKTLTAASVQTHVLASLKAYAALVGAIATALLGTFTDGKIGTILTIVVAVCTPIATYVVPNIESGNDADG